MERWRCDEALSFSAPCSDRSDYPDRVGPRVVGLVLVPGEESCGASRIGVGLEAVRTARRRKLRRSRCGGYAALELYYLCRNRVGRFSGVSPQSPFDSLAPSGVLAAVEAELCPRGATL